MTDEELYKTAEEYVKTNHSHIMSGTMKSIYKKIYLDGLAEGRKEKCLEQNIDGTIRPCEVMNDYFNLTKEKEILKNIISTILDKDDICYICQMKGQVLPECMRMENSECLKNMISLWSK